jgi:hypothetical protein
MFAIQSEIAKAIAEQLQAKLSPSETSAIERPSTTDITAFDLYAHAKDLGLRAGLGGTGRTNLLQAVDLLNRAVARDHRFSKPTASSPGLMTFFTSLGSTIHLDGSRKRKRPFRRRLAFVRTQAKRISRVRKIFTMDTSTTTALWLNWNLPVRACPMIPGYSS